MINRNACWRLGRCEGFAVLKHRSTYCLQSTTATSEQRSERKRKRKGERKRQHPRDQQNKTQFQTYRTA